MNAVDLITQSWGEVTLPQGVKARITLKPCTEAAPSILSHIALPESSPLAGSYILLHHFRRSKVEMDGGVWRVHWRSTSAPSWERAFQWAVEMLREDMGRLQEALNDPKGVDAYRCHREEGLDVPPVPRSRPPASFQRCGICYRVKCDCPERWRPYEDISLASYRISLPQQAGGCDVQVATAHVALDIERALSIAWERSVPALWSYWFAWWNENPAIPYSVQEWEILSVPCPAPSREQAVRWAVDYAKGGARRITQAIGPTAPLPSYSDIAERCSRLRSQPGLPGEARPIPADWLEPREEER